VKRKLFVVISLVLCFAFNAYAQKPDTAGKHPNTRPKVVPTPTPTPSPSPSPSPKAETQTDTAKGTTQVATAPKDPVAKEVLAVFDKLINGIRNADVEAVSSVYWNSPQLLLFNYNGTMTRTWEQMKKNRESSYPEIKDVVLDAREVRVQMLGRDGAVVSCFWKQSQTFRGNAETSSGRMTLVFRRVGKEWKAIHLHTSPDNPDKSRVPASEQSQ
jgi:ketosteroid isomerase-like protein